MASGKNFSKTISKKELSLLLPKIDSIFESEPAVFRTDIVDGFLKTNNLKRIVRGHTALMNGWEWWFDGKLLSLFSCPDYVGLKNDGAFALLGKGELKLFVLENQ